MASLCRAPKAHVSPGGRTRGLVVTEIRSLVQTEEVRSGAGRDRVRPWQVPQPHPFQRSQCAHFTDGNPEAPRGCAISPRPGAGTEEPGLKPRAGAVNEMPGPLCSLQSQGQSLAQDSPLYTPGQGLAGGTAPCRQLLGSQAA